MDTLTDYRVYSLFEYTKKRKTNQKLYKENFIIGLFFFYKKDLHHFTILEMYIVPFSLFNTVYIGMVTHERTEDQCSVII